MRDYLQRLIALIKGNIKMTTHKISEYLYEVKYTVLDYDFAKAYFKTHYVPVQGGCSVVRKGYQIGRNLDWYYDHEAEFIVETAAGMGRYASKGFAGTIAELTNTAVEEDGILDDIAKVLPFRMLDGINEKGVYASVNMLSNDATRSLADAGTTPMIEDREEICSIMAVRYILDKFATAQEAAEYIRDYVRVYPPIADGVKHDVQIVVADTTGTWVLSFEGTETRVITEEFHGVVTNFRLGGTTLVDGAYAIDGSNIEDYGSGVERANVALSMVSSSAIEEIMRSLHYTHAYDDNSPWLTEFVGIHSATIHDTATLRDSQIAARALYLATTRDKADTWHTTHTIVYDLDNKMAWCYTQQDDRKFRVLFVESSEGQVGPQGPEGPQGPQGPQGEKGEKGEPGHSGSYFPAVTIFGHPHIEGPQISGFSADDYLQFPFVVNFAGRPWTLHFDIATGADVSQQHNIFDSQFGLAFAFANGHFVMAMSSNGTSWDLGANEGTYAILPNQTYHIRMSWDGQTYKLEWSIDEVEWLTDIQVASTASLYPRQIVIGKDIFTGTHFYNGSINFAHAQLTIAGLVVWEGMTEVGTVTRMAIDMSNIDEEGIAKMEQIVGSFYVKGSMIRGNINLTGGTISGSSISASEIRAGSNTTISRNGIVVGSGTGSISAGFIYGSSISASEIRAGINTTISGSGIVVGGGAGSITAGFISGSSISASEIRAGSNTTISRNGIVVGGGAGSITAGFISGSSINASEIRAGINTTISGSGIVVGSGTGSISAGFISGSSISASEIRAGINTTISGSGIVVGSGTGSISAGFISGSSISASEIRVGINTTISGSGIVVDGGTGSITAGVISGYTIQVGSNTFISGGGITGPGFYYGSFYLSGNGFVLSGGALIMGSVTLSGGDIEKLHNL